MILLKHPVFHIIIFLILGILCGYYFPTDVKTVPVISSFLLVVLYGISLFAKKNSKYLSPFSIVTLIIFFFIGYTSISIKNDLNSKSHYTHFSKEALFLLKVTDELKQSKYYDKYKAEILKINSQSSQGKILLNIYKDSLSKKFNIDDEIIVSGTLNKVNEAKNPFQFNYKKYLARKNIYRQLTIKKEQYKVLKTETNTIKGYAHKFRNHISTSLKKEGFTDETLNIINALLLGKRQEVSKEIIENYTKAGAIHILAISGLHVGIILLILNFIFKPLERLKNGKHIKLILCVLLLWCFAFLAGLSASVIRAVTMFTAVAISYLGNKKTNVFQNLLVSIFFLLLFNPYYLFDVGFQLSYLAVFFIVWLQPALENLWHPKLNFVKYLWQILTVSTTAQIGVLPLSLYYFHQFPSLFFITNLVVIPFLSFILGFGIIVIILSVLNILPEFFITVYESIIQKMNLFISWVANQESFLVENISFSGYKMITSYLFLISLVYFLKKKSLKTLQLTLFSLLLIQTVFIYEKWGLTSSKETIIFNKNNNTLIGKRNGNQLTVFSNDSIHPTENSIKSYMTGNNIKSLTTKSNIKSTLLLNHNILIIDSLSVYNITNLRPEKVLLIQSPKINLERLIATLKPKIIIADNSNFKSYINRWKNTCNKHKVSFHYTNKQGAYILE